MSTPSKPNPLAIIYAGEDFPTITLLSGERVAVRVRAMPARHLAKVLHLATKEAELLDFVCYILVDGIATPVPEGWADNLTDEDHVKLYEAAKRLNFSKAAKWAERQIAAKEWAGNIERMADEVLLPIVMPMMQRLTESLTSSAKPSRKPVDAPMPS